MDDALKFPLTVDEGKGILVHRCECGRIHEDWMNKFRQQQNFEAIYGRDSPLMPMHPQVFKWECECGKSVLSETVKFTINSTEKQKWKDYLQRQGIPIS